MWNIIIYILIDKRLQLLDPYWGFAPGPHWGKA